VANVHTLGGVLCGAIAPRMKGVVMRRKPAAAMAYQLPEEEYQALQRARDHLRLLARLTEPRNFADDQDLRLSPLALTDCFQRLADDPDDIVRVAWWPGG
jgi:hypothetical protein